MFAINGKKSQGLSPTTSIRLKIVADATGAVQLPAAQSQYKWSIG